MNCPNCQAESNTVSVKSLNPGMVVNLDQCPKCGGIWFDQDELYQVPIDEAKKIDAADKDLLEKLGPINRNLLCPVDETKLGRLIDPNIPQDVHIFRCPKCSGAWLNKGELIKFDEEKKNKDLPSKPKSKDIRLSYAHRPYAEIKKMLEKKMGKSAYTDTVAKIVAYFTRPIADTGPNFSLPDQDIEEQSVLSPDEKEQIAMTPPEQREELYENFINYEQSGIEYKAKKLAEMFLSSISSSIASILDFLFSPNIDY